jgi:DNA-directed DNA polymerase III PolC
MEFASLYNVLTDERRAELKDAFVNIHAHSFYSLLDGQTRPADLIDKTLQLGQPAACISDHGVMYSLVDFVTLANKKKQKYLIAMEAYVVRDHRLKGKAESDNENTNNREHLLLVAYNEKGYKNLMKLASIGATEGFYYRPRIDDELLKRNREGLLATSACLGSRFSQLIARGNLEDAKKELRYYAKMFPGKFFLEIQPTKEYMQKVVNHALIKLSAELGIPMVSTTDAHYLNRQDSETHDALLAMQSNDTLSNPLRWRFPGDTFFVASRKEMLDMYEEECESEIDKLLQERDPSEWLVDSEDTIFTKTIDFIDKKTGKPAQVDKKFIRFKHNIDRNLLEKSCDNSVVIADTCDFQLKFDKTYLPKVEIPENQDFLNWYQAKVQQAQNAGQEPQTKQDYYLRYLCIKGLKDKGLTAKNYRERLEYELDVIISMGFPDYFLLLQDVVSWCYNNDIPVGPGRGCFTPEQIVETSEGKKYIEDVTKGDMVITHRGNLKEVKSVQSYKADEEIAIVKWRSKDEPETPLTVKSTKDHEYFIIPKHYGKDFKNTKWAMASELEKGDILLLPIEREMAHKHSHKGHENCINCFGKKNPDFIEEANRQFHETAFNVSRIVEKTINVLGTKVDDEGQTAVLDKAKSSLQEVQEVFGFNEVINSEISMEQFSEELLELGYEIGFVEEVTYKHYEGMVYDLTVDGDTSYTVNGLAVHNSAAGSLVSYAIGITNVDPIQYGLLFERFLNPTRGKLPDIDVDFCIDNRGRVMKYIIEKYGTEHTANIATFGRLQTKAVIKDVAKALAIEFDEVNNFTKLLPSGPGASIHIEDIYNMPECQSFVQKYPKLFEYAAKLEGSPRHVSQHAAGIVVSPPDHPIWSLIPIQKAKKEMDGITSYLTQLEKGPVEELGLVKMDILGLKNITELHEQFKLVKKLYGNNLNFNNIPLDDKKTWDLIGNGHTLGVFQFASNLAISALHKIKPQNIEELSAANAFIRPGASGLEEYMMAKTDARKRRKLHQELDSILEATYGAIVYQEQIMGLIAVVMGIDFGEADIYRRMLEKAGKFPQELADWKIKFTEMGLARGYNQKLIDLLVNLIIENSGYGFNKSHAVAYSIISYWTAYMKANYPLIFYTAMLNGNLDQAEFFMAEAHKIGIKVLPPHVNDSKLLFTISGDEGIRAGFNAIKGVGPKAVESIIANQPFASVDDYFVRNDKAAINKGVVGALLKAGAFEGMGIQVEEGDIPVELNDKFEFKDINNDKYVVLNREQAVVWFDLLNDINTVKASPNFIVPTELIAGKYFDKYELVEEKDGSGVVIPEDVLKDMGIKLTSLPDQTKTRKKPKGSFDKAADPMKNVAPFRKPFIIHHRKLSEIAISYMDLYLKEQEEFGFSFLPHPLEKHMDKINLYDDVEDGQPMVTAGIITSIVQRMTKTKKPFYWVTVKSPRDSVRVTLWDNQFNAHKEHMHKNALIVVKGNKGYGGIGCESLKAINFSV